MTYPVAYLRDAQPAAEDPALVVCAKDDPGAVPVYADDLRDELGKALAWAMERFQPVRLVRGQNDAFYEAYQQARAALNAYEAGK